MNLEKVAIVGATGYSGEELVRILIRHPGIDLVCLTSRTHAGKRLEEVAPRFQGQKFSELPFSESDVGAITGSGARFVFLALPHGVAAEYAGPLVDAGLRVIDLSADFRLKDIETYREYYSVDHIAPDLLARSVYGLPEIYRDQIRAARLVAAPGCYPTSIILPLAPLLRAGLIDPESIVVTSMSGVTGAGRKTASDYLFAECNESVRPYGIPKHRHLAEIEQELSIAAGSGVVISFAPHLVPLNRGILSTIHLSPAPGIQPQALSAALMEAYKEEVFVRLQGERLLPDVKNVAFTNYIDIGWRHDPRTGRFILFSAIDNLVKGAAGQAVQCLNLMCGWPEPVAL